MLAALVTAAVVAAIIGATVKADRRHAARSATVYGQLRRMKTHELTFGDPTHEQAAELDQLAIHVGMRRLGDVVARYGDLEMPIRLSIDSAGTTLAVVGNLIGPFLDLCSFAANDQHVTITRSCKFVYPFTAPPFVRRKGLGVKPASDALAAHMTRINGLTGLRVLASLDDAKLVLMRLHSRDVAWRNTIDVDELLELDLRVYLGRRYDVLGHGMKRELRELPGARVLRGL